MSQRHAGRRGVQTGDFWVVSWGLGVAWGCRCLALPLEQSAPGKGDRVMFTRAVYDAEESRDDFDKDLAISNL